MAFALLLLAILPVYLVMALIATVIDGIANLVDKRRRAKQLEQARLFQIHAQEARARYQLDQITVAARQAILDAANKQS